MRAATADELTRMKAVVSQSMEEARSRFSTGLEYPPMRYSTTEAAAVDYEAPKRLKREKPHRSSATGQWVDIAT